PAMTVESRRFNCRFWHGDQISPLFLLPASGAGGWLDGGLGFGHDLGRRVDRRQDDGGHGFGGPLPPLEAELLGLGQEGVVLHGCVERLAQRGDAIRRNVLGREERPPERRRRRHQRQYLALLGGFPELMHERHVAVVLVALGADLDQRN